VLYVACVGVAPCEGLQSKEGQGALPLPVAQIPGPTDSPHPSAFDSAVEPSSLRSHSNSLSHPHAHPRAYLSRMLVHRYVHAYLSILCLHSHSRSRSRSLTRQVHDYLRGICSDVHVVKGQFDDNAALPERKVWPRSRCPPRYRLLFDLRNEGSKCFERRGGQWAWLILLSTS